MTLNATTTRALAAAAGLTAVLTAGVLGVAPADAAARTLADYAAPYAVSSAPLVDTCVAGASCAVKATADRATGRTTAALDYDRATTGTGAEALEGRPSFQVPVQLPKGSTSATVSVTWHVDSATAAAVSSRGTVRAGSLLEAGAICSSGCTTSPAIQEVTLACSDAGVLPCTSTPGSDSSRAEGVDMTVELSVQDLAKPSFTVWTDMRSYIDAGPLCGASTSVQQVFPLMEDCSTQIDPLHAGTAHSDLSARLVGIHVDAA